MYAAECVFANAGYEAQPDSAITWLSAGTVFVCELATVTERSPYARLVLAT